MIARKLLRRTWPTLIVDNTKPDRSLDPLSSEQRLAVASTLAEWSKQYAAGAVNINTNRKASGAIPTWADWSGCPWVAHHAGLYRSETFSRLSRWHITTLMHMALPPFWHADGTVEVDCALRYGHWKDELTWLPPSQINGTTQWVGR